MIRRRGLTILRFAHAFATGGGVETYLEDLDRTLLARNAWTIIRMHLEKKGGPRDQNRDVLGRGQLIRVPLYAEQRNQIRDSDLRGGVARWPGWVKDHLRDHVLYNPLLYSLIFRMIIQRQPIPKRDIEAIGARKAASEIMRAHKIDLLVMHYVGGADTAGIIEEALSRSIPYVVINHFSNDRLNHLSVREQIAKAAGVAGVSGLDVPLHLRKGFVNVSDGIDTELFRRETANPVPIQVNAPIVLLPARLTPTKGQSDLIRACATLRNEGIRLTVALAGRADSHRYIQELIELAGQLGVERDILFLGELSPAQLRDWYSTAAVLAFPTYHHEGLPRVLLESQAMNTPPISYIIGGTAEAIIHGQTGFLVKKSNVPELAIRIRELLTDERKHKRMAEAGRALVEEHFSVHTLASRHEDFYSRALTIMR